MDSSGPDRYSSLLHTLRAGREIAVQPRTRQRLEWHPVAAKMLIAAAVLVAAYLVATTGYRLLRERSLDTWAGPDATVQSGQRLDGCPLANVRDYDAAYPNWVRFGGAVFIATGFSRPFGSNADNAYTPTGYHLNELELWRVANTPDGRAGRAVLLKLRDNPIGQLFVASPDCT